MGSDKQVEVKVLTDVEGLEKVTAIEDHIRKIKMEKLQLQIDANTSKLKETEKRIESLKIFLDTVNTGNTNINIDDSQIRKAEAELEALESEKIDLALAVEKDSLEHARAEVEELDGTTVDVEVQAAMQNFTQGVQQAKQGVDELYDSIMEVQQAGMQSEQNKAFLEMNLGAEQAKKTYQDISDIVASMPGDDNTMRSVLSTAQALGNNLDADDMKAAAATMADYMSGSATMGKMAKESEQDIMKYLLDGNTAELERGSIVSSRVDKLKEANTFMERQQAMQEVLNELGYGGIANQDTMLNKQAEWEGMIYNSQDALSSMWLGAEKGAMDYILKLNDATDGFAGMAIVAASFAGGPLIDTFSGLGQMAVGMQAIKDLGMIQYIKDLEIVTKLSAAADWLLSGAQAVLNAIMAMNPIVLVVIALVALAAALIWAYYNVDWFRQMVDEAWASLQQFGQMLVNNIRKAITQFGKAVEGIPKALERCLQWAYNLVMNHPLVQALIWLGNKASEAFAILGLGQQSPGKIVKAMKKELDWTSEAIYDSDLAEDTARLGANISKSFNPSLYDGKGSTPSSGNGSGNGINLYLTIGSVDSEERVREIVDAITRALAWNNVTAGRSV